MRFSSEEVVQILLAVGALTLAFTLAQVVGVAYLGAQGPVTLADVGIKALVSFIAVVTAFLLHELAHKAIAQRYGCYAEFRAFPMGLLLGIVTAAFGWLFAAPGAVMISGPVTPRQNARISAAGPGTNFAIASAFLGVALLIGVPTNGAAGFTYFLAGSVSFVNLFLGGFNMVPFPPLDGSKMFAYNKPMWIALLAILAAIAVAGYTAHVY